MKEKYKVVFISPFPPPYGGIAEISNSLYDSLSGHCFSSIKLNMSASGAISENVSEKKTVNIRKIIVGLQKLIHIIYSEKPDAFYIAVSGDKSCFREMLLSFVIKLFTSAPIIMHLHGIFKEYKKNFPFVLSHRNRLINRVLINFLISTSSKTLFISKRIMEDFELILWKKNKKKIDYINNFVDPRNFKIKDKCKDDIKKAIFIGRLSYKKGFFDLIEAAMQLAGKKIEFHICGLPEKETSLNAIKEKIEILTKTNSIKFHGLVSGNAKYDLLSKADIMVFPSHEEAFPVVVLEGLAQGIPIVTTNAGIISEIIKNEENGILIESGKPEAITSALLKLLNNPYLYNKISGINRAFDLSQYSIQYGASKLANLILSEIKIVQRTKS